MTEIKILSMEEQQERIRKELMEYISKIFKYCSMSSEEREIIILVQGQTIEWKLEGIKKQLEELQDSVGKQKV